MAVDAPNIIPSWHSPFARNRSVAMYPNLHDGLFGYWVAALGPTGTFLADVGPRKNHGTVNGITAAEWGTDAMGSYLIYGGSSADDVTADRDIDLRGMGEVTVITRFTWDDSPSAEHSLVSNWDNAAAKASFLIRLEPSGNAVEVFMVEEADNQIGGTLSGITVSANEHHHLAVRFSLSRGTIQAMLDGVLSGTAAVSAAFDATLNDNGLQFGNSPHGTSDPLTGRIYSVAIYERSLTNEEMRQDYMVPYAPLMLAPRVVGKAPAAAPAGFTPRLSLLGVG